MPDGVTERQSKALPARIAPHLVPSVPQALKALAAMERELDSAATYAAIRKVIHAAEALKTLLGEVAEVKQQAEWVVLLANQRIDAEIKRVPKQSSRAGRLHGGREGLGIPAVTRSRIGQIGALSTPALKAAATELWQGGKDATVRAVAASLKEAERKQERREYEARRDRGATVGDLAAMAAAGQRFNVIYADPPWEFRTYSDKGKQRSADRHYDTSSLDALKALPIAPLAADNCLLFLWAIWPQLPAALELIRAWGFEYSTDGFLWVKQVSPTNPALFTGMGYWTRANSEPCLLATRGTPRRMAMDVAQVILSPVGKHSAKPAEARDRIERLALGPYLELFARAPVPRWTVWGNEVLAGVAEAAA